MGNFIDTFLQCLHRMPRQARESDDNDMTSERASEHEELEQNFAQGAEQQGAEGAQPLESEPKHRKQMAKEQKDKAAFGLQLKAFLSLANREKQMPSAKSVDGECDKQLNVEFEASGNWQISFDFLEVPEKIIKQQEKQNHRKQKQRKQQQQKQQNEEYDKKKKKNKEKIVWKAPLHPIDINIYSQKTSEDGSAHNQLISEVNHTIKQYHRLFTALFHDACQLATRLFRCSSYEQITVTCSDKLIRSCFVELSKDEFLPFFNWFSTVVIKQLFSANAAQVSFDRLSTSSDFIWEDPNDTVLSTTDGEVFRQEPICILFNESKAYIECIKPKNRKFRSLLDSFSPSLYHLPLQRFNELRSLPLLELLQNLKDRNPFFTNRKPEQDYIEIVVVPCTTSLILLDILGKTRNSALTPSTSAGSSGPSNEQQGTSLRLSMIENEVSREITKSAYGVIDKEVEHYEELPPTELEKLRKRVALLSILCYYLVHDNNQTADSSEYFAKLFRLMERICCPKDLQPMEAKAADRARPSLLLQVKPTAETDVLLANASKTMSKSTGTPLRQAFQLEASNSSCRESKYAHKAAKFWELPISDCTAKLFLVVPQKYYENKVVILLLYLAICDAANCFHSFMKQEKVKGIEIPCFLEFCTLKRAKKDSAAVDTLLSEYICLVKLCCSSIFQHFCLYTAEQESLDFYFCDQSANQHGISVKSYNSLPSDLLHISRWDNSREFPDDISGLQKLAQKCIGSNENGKLQKWTGIIFNCIGESCTKSGKEVFWKISNNSTLPNSIECCGCKCQKEQFYKCAYEEVSPNITKVVTCDQLAADKLQVQATSGGTNEQSAEETNEQVKEQANEQSTEEANEQVKEEANEQVKEEMNEQVKEEANEQSTEEANEQIKETSGLANDECPNESPKSVQGVFIPGHVFFDTRFALRSFQPSCIKPSHSLVELLNDCLCSASTSYVYTYESTGKTIKKL